MSVVPNQTKRRLAAGGLAIGLGLRLARTVDIATIAKACDYDWLFIDMEHGSLDVDRAAQIAVAALAVGVTPIARVPGPEHYHASRLLDAGAQGIVVPHVDTAAQA
ncbi:MAG TPA: aldolase/citrate lyase family protein, partial [Burkholderiales bacterium]|nr:aldolase/citrate lyase family protein [Burkholderiales bacterium]